MKYEALKKNKGVIISEGDEYAMPNDSDWEAVPKKFHGQKLTSRKHSCDYRRPIPEAKVVKPVDWKTVARRMAVEILAERWGAAIEQYESAKAREKRSRK